MATTLKRLGAVSISSVNSWTTLYTVPSATAAVAATLFVVNRDIYEASIDVAWLQSAGEPVDADYLYSGVDSEANTTQALRLNLTMSAGNVLVVRSSEPTSNFVLSGVEIT
jgi:hypothetical protein